MRAVRKRVCITAAFRELCSLEPGLRLLVRMARMERRGDGFYCANEVWYDQFKPRLETLVGWGARSSDPRLRTEKAYDIAYDTIYGMLPNCRGCACG